MTALPPKREVDDKGFFKDHGNGLSAYEVCLKLQEHAVSTGFNNSIIAARALGYLILYPPSVTACHVVVNEIHSCRHDFPRLLRLGDFYVKTFIRLFKKFKGRTPSSSNHSSRPSFDSAKENKIAIINIKEAPKTHADAKKQVLRRDGYKCVITGKYDESAPGDIYSDSEILRAGGAVYTECVHIVPESTYSNVSTTDIEGSSEKKDYASSVLAILQRFGYSIDKLNGPKVHSLYNVMTLQKDVYDLFDRLELYLEETHVKNCYIVKTFNPRFGIPAQEITFTTPDPDEFPLPDPALLAMHASCAKVAHLSGAGKYIDQVDRDVEELGVLAHDGGSSDVLTHAILRSCATVDIRG